MFSQNSSLDEFDLILPKCNLKIVLPNFVLLQMNNNYNFFEWDDLVDKGTFVDDDGLLHEAIIVDDLQRKIPKLQLKFSKEIKKTRIFTGLGFVVFRPHT